MTEVRKKTKLEFLDDGAVALAGAVLGLNLAVASYPTTSHLWRTVYHWLRARRIDGTWEQLNAALRERLRVRLAGPSYCPYSP